MSRYWVAACAAVIAVFGGLVPVAESASATPASEVRPSACGPEKFQRPDGSRYECSFVDDFSGTELDDEKWMVQVSSNLSGFSPGRTCFIDSPDNVFVQDGHLNLVGRVGDLPARCKTPYRLFFSKYTGGAVVTWDRFSQTYGRFSFRAKYPGTDEAGYNSNIWMSPQKLTYGRWPRSGEIDIAEYWSGHPDMVHPSLHYTGHSRADTAWDCKVPNVGDFHIYTLEWTPTEMRFFYDDTLCFERSWKPWMHPRDGRPFNHPFGLVMSQGIWDPYFPVSKELPKSGTMQVDWVRVWR